MPITALPTKKQGQRSVNLPLYLDRYVPAWSSPEWLDANVWRKIVANQPLAVICRDTLIANITALDWKIEPVDSNMRDEVREDIKYYEKFFQYTGDYDYVDILEWICKDALDIPFGGVLEIGRENDEPNGKILWIELLDGGTCFPTLNANLPVGQRVPELSISPVYFPKYAVNRLYYSPRTEIRRKGWGMPPPEKIYLALELLNRGDKYYAHLLLDTPEVGILDLADMEKTSAEEWVQSWRELLNGIDPFKIPVLYEHEKPATFISFNRSPAELMFDKATMKYAAILAAGYGMSLSDIGMQVASSGGETLAGSIRQERRTRRTGLALLKKKVKAFFDRMLPNTLEFSFIDLDDELSVARSRARLGDSQAWSLFIENKVFTPQEARLQAIADGIVTISIPEEYPEDANAPQAKNPVPNKRDYMGNPVPPSLGGQGEVRLSDAFTREVDKYVEVEDIYLRKLVRSIIPIMQSEVSKVITLFDDEDGIDLWNEWYDDVLWGDVVDDDIPALTKSTIRNSQKTLLNILKTDKMWNKSVDMPDILKDLVELYRKSRVDYLTRKSELEYELGKIPEIIREFPDDPESEKQFSEAMTEKVKKFFDEFSKNMTKSVISGVRKYLSTHYDAEMADVNDSVIKLVRIELYNLRNAMIEQFAQDTLETIQTILKE